MSWTLADVQSAGEGRDLMFRERLRNADNARTDAKKAQRLAMHECKWCWYFGRGVVGHMFTAFTCAHCSAECSHPNTAAPKLCDQCGEKLNACVRCGGAMEWE